MSELLNKLYQLFSAAEYSQVQLAAQIMRSGNHTRDELISVIDRFFTEHRDTLYWQIHWALNLDCTKRQLETSYGLDFLLKIHSQENIHVCILLEKRKYNSYYLDRIDLRCHDLDHLIFCPSDRFTSKPIKKYSLKSSYDYDKRGLDQKLIFVSTVFHTDQYDRELTESLRSVLYDFVLDNILSGNLIA